MQPKFLSSLNLLCACCFVATTLNAAAIDEATVLAAMNKPDRLADDIARDRRSQPQAVIPLLGLEAGDRAVSVR